MMNTKDRRWHGCVAQPLSILISPLVRLYTLFISPIHRFA